MKPTPVISQRAATKLLKVGVLFSDSHKRQNTVPSALCPRFLCQEQGTFCTIQDEGHSSTSCSRSVVSEVVKRRERVVDYA